MNKKTARCLTGGFLHSMTIMFVIGLEFVIGKISKSQIYYTIIARDTGFLEAIETRFYFWTYLREKFSKKHVNSLTNKAFLIILLTYQEEKHEKNPKTCYFRCSSSC